MECRRSCVPVVYSEDSIPIVETLLTQRILSTILSFKMKQEYSELCGFVRARMSLSIVRSNSLLLRGPWYKEACIRQQPELLDGSVMALLVQWRG